MSKQDDLPFATTIEVRDACLCLHVQRAARTLARHFDDALRPLNLTNGQFSLLMSLNRPEPATIGDVATVLAMDRTTLTAAVKPLQRRGLIEIRKDGCDRRARRLILTKEGRALLVQAVAIWRAVHRTLEAQMEDAGRFRDELRSFH